MQRETNLGYALEKFVQAVNDFTNEPGGPQDWLLRRPLMKAW
jgi:hypothetical protein